MEIDVALVPAAARAAGASALIVVDEIRASTTITAVLDAGVSDLLLSAGIAPAIRLARATGSLVAGEYHARKPDGFDFDNSPTALVRADLRGRSLVLSTTNGTAILRRLRGSPNVLVGCLRNARACAAAAVRLAGADAHRILVVCAGREGRFVLEDAVAAGVIVTRLAETIEAAGREARLTDAAKAAVFLRASYPDLPTALEASDGGDTLRQIGQAEDTPFCAEEDMSTTVAIVRHGPPMRALPVA